MIGWPIRPAPMTPTRRIGGSAPARFIAGSERSGSRTRSEPGLRGAEPGLRCRGGGPGLRGEDTAFLRVDMHEDRAADRRAQRGMLAREQRPRTDGDAEVDRLAEKHLLLDGSLPHVLT